MDTLRVTVINEERRTYFSLVVKSKTTYCIISIFLFGFESNAKVIHSFLAFVRPVLNTFMLNRKRERERDQERFALVNGLCHLRTDEWPWWSIEYVIAKSFEESQEQLPQSELEKTTAVIQSELDPREKRTLSSYVEFTRSISVDIRGIDVITGRICG